MAYNHKNKLLLYQKIVDIVNERYEDGITTYKGIWSKYVYPVYPISYGKFLEILNTPNLQKKIQEESARCNKQIPLF